MFLYNYNNTVIECGYTVYYTKRMFNKYNVDKNTELPDSAGSEYYF